MKTLRLSHPDGILHGRIYLPLSKSECNRALILESLSNGVVKVDAVSDAEDSRLLRQLLQSDAAVLDAGHAGTVARFLCALLAFREGERILTGSARMRERPLAPLVDALRQAGAHIEYIEQEGFLPVRISGCDPAACGGRVRLSGAVSSQFLSALAMVAPLLGKGLELVVEDEITSRPYFDMTLAMLGSCGIAYEQKNQTYIFRPSAFVPVVIRPEPDWSSAAYLYALAALSQDTDIYMPGLNAASLQADAITLDLFTRFGVYSEATGSGIRIRRGGAKTIKKFEYDFRACPDLAQTLIALCAGLGLPASFSGLHTLRHKESDRVQAMSRELQKAGIRLSAISADACTLEPGDPPAHPIVFDTWNDHRMALSLSALSLVFGEVEIREPEVVAKSWPSYWDALRELGFSIR